MARGMALASRCRRWLVALGLLAGLCTGLCAGLEAATATHLRGSATPLQADGRVALLSGRMPEVLERLLAAQLEAGGERVTVRLPSGPDRTLADARASGSQSPDELLVDPALGRRSLTRSAASRLRSAAVIELRGGSFIAWWTACFPEGRRGPLLAALEEAHSRGCWIVAHPGAAGLLAGGARVPATDWKSLPGGRPPARNPRRPATGPATLGGLRLAGDALWAASPAEAAGVLHAGELERALVPLGDLAWVWSRGKGGRILADGQGVSALWLDARGARRAGRWLHDVQLERLRPGGSPTRRRPPLARAVPVVQLPSGSGAAALDEQLGDGASGPWRLRIPPPEDRD